MISRIVNSIIYEYQKVAYILKLIMSALFSLPV